ncbi:MAG: DNA-binding protein [Thermoproteus sp.]
MSDDIDTIIKRKALEIAAKQMVKKQEEKPLSKEDILKTVRSLLKGDRAEEILDTALELYGDSLIPLFRKIVELHRQGIIKELWDHELYRILTNAGFVIPLKTRLRIVRHGREYKLGEGD